MANAIERQSVLEANPQRGTRTDEWAVLGCVRFALACVVMLSHLSWYNRDFTRITVATTLTSPGLLSGFAAVLAFFIISGYSMAHSLSKDGNVRRFYERRFWRIAPLYLFGILIAYAPCAYFMVAGYSGRGPGFYEFPDPAQFGQALAAMQGISMVSIPGNGVLWTLGIEIWLYAFSPFFTRMRFRTLIVIAGTSIAVFLLHNHLRTVEYCNETHGWAHASLSWAFIAGFLIYRFRERMPSLSILMMLAVWLICDADQEWRAATNTHYAPLLLPLALYFIYQARAFRLNDKARKWLSWLGDISFPLYITHGVVLEFAEGLAYKNIPMVIMACLLIAVASFYLIDFPVRVYVRKRSRNTPEGFNAYVSTSRLTYPL